MIDQKVSRIQTMEFEENNLLEIRKANGNLKFIFSDLINFPSFLWRISRCLQNLNEEKNFFTLLEENGINRKNFFIFQWGKIKIKIPINILIKNIYFENYCNSITKIFEIATTSDNEKMYVVRAENISMFFLEISKKLTKMKITGEERPKKITFIFESDRTIKICCFKSYKI